MTMASKTETDIEALAGELSDLRSQIAKVAERLTDTASHATQDASSIGRRAWATVQDEAEPYLRGIEEHPVRGVGAVSRPSVFPPFLSGSAGWAARG
jgi:hypothetical protein